MRTNLKILLIISLVLTFGIFLGANAYAKDVDPFSVEVYGLIPDNMKLDIKETEYKKAYEAIRDNLISIFENDGITTKEEIGDYGEKTLILTKGDSTANISISTPNFYESPEYFYEANVAVWDYNDKTFAITYSTKATDADKEYVKKIVLKESEYAEVDPDKYFSMDNVKYSEEYAKEYFVKQINDSKVQVMTEIYYWDGSDINTRMHSVRVALFKDDALCEIRTLKIGVTLPVIMVPANIKEDAYPDYIKSVMMKYDEDFTKGVSEIKKGNASQNGILLNSKLEVEGMYTLLNDNNNGDGYLIARKYGDIDSNGKINIEDAILILKSMTGKEKLTDAQIKIADVTKDGKADIKDAILILKYIVGKVKEL